MPADILAAAKELKRKKKRTKNIIFAKKPKYAEKKLKMFLVKLIEPCFIFK